MINLIRTGVFATKDELDDLRRGSDEAAKVPVVSLTGKANALHDLQQVCHQVALSHKLPKIQGCYGIDLQNGEFVKYE